MNFGLKLLACIVWGYVQPWLAAATVPFYNLNKNSWISNATCGKYWQMAAAVVRDVFDSWAAWEGNLTEGSKFSNTLKWFMFNQSVPVWLSLHLEIMEKLGSGNCLWVKMKEIDGSDLISTDTTSADYESLGEEYGLKWRFFIYHSSQLLLNHEFLWVRYSDCSMLKKDNTTDERRILSCGCGEC